MDKDDDTAEKLFELSVRRYRTKMLAWHRFCHHTEINSESARRAFGIHEDIPMDFAAELGFDRPSEEEIIAQLNPLLETWTRSIAAIG